MPSIYQNTVGNLTVQIWFRYQPPYRISGSIEGTTLKITKIHPTYNDYSCPLINTGGISPWFIGYLKKPIGSIWWRDKRFSRTFARFGKATTGNRHQNPFYCAGLSYWCSAVTRADVHKKKHSTFITCSIKTPYKWCNTYMYLYMRLNWQILCASQSITSFYQPIQAINYCECSKFCRK